MDLKVYREAIGTYPKGWEKFHQILSVTLGSLNLHLSFLYTPEIQAI